MTTTQTAQHTPGPWRIFIGNGVPHFKYPPPEVVNSEGLRIAAFSNWGMQQATQEANAALIAKAPQLLEQCEYWLSYARGDPRYAAWLGKTEAIVAEARGQS